MENDIDTKIAAQNGCTEAYKEIMQLREKLKNQQQEFQSLAQHTFDEAYTAIQEAKNNPNLYLSEIQMTFETLQQAMNLPRTCKVVAVKETDHKGIVTVRVASTTEPPEEYGFAHLSMAGEAYANPHKYKGSNKGQMRGAEPLPEVADVAVTR